MQLCCINFVFMRKTRAIQTILEILNKSDIALSQSEIQEILPQGLCNRVTIYRVLNRLVKENLIHEITNIDGVVKYANCKNCKRNHTHDHLHFNCEKCNTVTCIEHVEPVFQMPKNYRINKINFMVSGICPNCAID